MIYWRTVHAFVYRHLVLKWCWDFILVGKYLALYRCISFFPAQLVVEVISVCTIRLTRGDSRVANARICKNCLKFWWVTYERRSRSSLGKFHSVHSGAFLLLPVQISRSLGRWRQVVLLSFPSHLLLRDGVLGITKSNRAFGFIGT
jgi:hypothetical protein